MLTPELLPIILMILTAKTRNFDSESVTARLSLFRATRRVNRDREKLEMNKPGTVPLMIAIMIPAAQT